MQSNTLSISYQKRGVPTPLFLPLTFFIEKKKLKWHLWIKHVFQGE